MDRSACDLEPVTNPQTELPKIAAIAVAAYKADPGNSALLRECRVTLLALAGDQELPEVDEIETIKASWEAGE